MSMILGLVLVGHLSAARSAEGQRGAGADPRSPVAAGSTSTGCSAKVSTVNTQPSFVPKEKRRSRAVAPPTQWSRSTGSRTT
jgi:hypothetical protein